MFQKVKTIYFGFTLFFSLTVLSDSFDYNNYNNHGVVGLINMPTARFFDESSHGFTFNFSDPDQKITMTSSPFDWLEASFFYTNISNANYCADLEEPICRQDYKDKGFNAKIRLKEEGKLPALAIGLNDFGGTGLYSSEYIVASYGIDNLDLHFGLGWGNLNSSEDFKNPLIYLHDSFGTRPDFTESEGGQFQKDRYFSDSSITPFFGLSYALNDKSIIKLERDTTKTSGIIKYKKNEFPISIGFDYKLRENFNIGLSFERGNTFSVKFSYKKKNDPPLKNNYKRVEKVGNQDEYAHLRSNLERNGIGVNKIIESDKKIGLELTQFQHGNSQIIDQIISDAKNVSEIEKDFVINYKIADLYAVKNFDEAELDNSKIIYQRNPRAGLYTDTRIRLRPYLAAREGFLKMAVLAENDLEYVFKDNFFFSSNLKYSLWDNFGDLIYPPENTYPAQVRSDIKDYLRNFNDGIVIGRAQFDGFKTISENNHLMFSFGIFEEMFSGYGAEYLHFNNESNHAYGFEIFHVYKRDYELRFGTLDYDQTTAHLNYYYRNYGLIPFDLKASYGKYLAGDIGGTIELSRSFSNGVSFGVFATFTDVSSRDYGEGSFDKGVFFNIPIFSNLTSYTWRPLTKDPGAKLIRKNNLFDLLVKFRPIN